VQGTSPAGVQGGSPWLPLFPKRVVENALGGIPEDRDSTDKQHNRINVKEGRVLCLYIVPYIMKILMVPLFVMSVVSH